MTYMNIQGSSRKVWPAVIAGVSLFIAGALSIAGLNLFGVRVGFGFIPLIVLAIWPRRADPLVSICIVFAAGLFTDWATGGIRGQWTLVFVLVWGFLRPEIRDDPFAPVHLLLIWLATCGLALLVLSITGFFVFGIMSDVASMGRQMIFATVLMPFLMLLRHGLAVRFNEHEDWG